MNQKFDLIIISPDFHINSMMNGMGYRLWEIALALVSNKDFRIKIFQQQPSDFQHPMIEFGIYDKHKIDIISEMSQVFLITYGFNANTVNYLKSFGKKIIIDSLITPIETLEYQKVKDFKTKKQRERFFNMQISNYKKLIKLCDYIIVGSIEEKSLMIGQLLMTKCINSENHNKFEKILDIIPIGFYSDDSFYSKKINNTFVWNGGVWNHYNINELLIAFKNIHKYYADVKIRFLYQSRTENFKIIEKLLNTKQNYILGPIQGIDYFNRNKELSSAKGVIVLTNDTLESYTTLRLRLRDVLLYSIPIITSKYGLLGKFVENNNIGLVVDNSSNSIENALTIFINDHSNYQLYKENINRIKENFNYRNTVINLRSYIQEINKVQNDKITQ